jgi:hypothetical protein
MSPLVQCMPLCWAGAILTSVVRNACRSDTHIVTSLKTERSARPRPSDIARPHADVGRKALSGVLRRSGIRFAGASCHGCNGDRMRFVISWPEGTIAAHAASLLHTHRGRTGSRSASDERRSQSSGTTDVWGSNVSKLAIRLLVHDREADHFTLVAELRAEARNAISGIQSCSARP